MSVIDLIEPQTHSRLKAGMLAAAMIPSASAPGVLCQSEWSIPSEIQPSGCVDALKYWSEFTPVLTDHESTILPLLIGSGGDSTFSKVIRIEESQSDGGSAAITPISHSETIAYIRGALSLQLKELAEVLRVQRPTIYSWINGEVEPSAANRERMQQVYRLASEWSSRCKLPAERLVRASGTDGHSVLDLLKADDINVADIVGRFEGLAVERLRMKADADRKRPAATAVARAHGFNVDEISDQQHLIDAATGKRSSPD